MTLPGSRAMLQRLLLKGRAIDWNITISTGHDCGNKGYRAAAAAGRQFLTGIVRIRLIHTERVRMIVPSN